MAPPELAGGEQELLADFLSRLQAIIRRPADAPGSADDTRPALRARRRSRS
ncbi:MAG: hypothetical protein ACRD3M_18950 [Thermoanaerobaculia bacterium]